MNNEDQYKNKKILFFLSNLSGGGAQRTMVNLLKTIDRKKFSPTLVLLEHNQKDAYSSLIPNDVKIINLNSRARKAIWKIKKLIDKTQPEILFSTLPQVNFAVWAASKISNFKPKLVLRETNHREIGINTTFIEQLLYRIIYSNADKVIGLSSGVASHMIETYKLDSTKVSRIYNPIDINEIRIKSIENCDIGYSKGFKLIACGRLTEQKNFSILIKAIFILKQKGYYDFELFIMGEGPEEKLLENMISDYGLEENIQLIGFKKNPYAFMKQADLFILSSNWEGFGHVIVEAMACSTAVLSTDCPSGPNEIINNRKNGLLCKVGSEEDLAEKIDLLYKDKLLRRKITENGFERSKDFDIQNICKEYEELFLSL